MPDCVDFKLKMPELEYANKVWGYEDVFEHVKRGERDVAGTDLMKQIFGVTLGHKRAICYPR